MTNRTRIEKNELRNLVGSAMPEQSCEDDDLVSFSSIVASFYKFGSYITA